MPVLMYFLYLSMRKRLCLGGIGGLLITLLIKAILTRIRLRVVFAIFGSPRFFKDYFTCCSRHSIRCCFLSIDSYIALTLILNPRDQNEVSSLKYFSKILSLLPHGELFLHRLIYLSCLLLFFYNKDFSLFVRFFPRPSLLDELPP